MRITSQISYSYPCLDRQDSRTGTAFVKREQSYNTPSFGSIPQVVADKCANIVYNPLRNFSEFSLKEYSTLTPRQIKVLRSRFNHLADSAYFYKNAEIIHDKVSDSIISNLDNKFGTGKYDVIILGRSLSSVGKVMGYKLGEERVVNIPISHAGKYIEDKNCDDKTIHSFNKLLSKFGVKRENFSDHDRKLIVMDFCCSGESLKAGTNLVKKALNLDDNVVPVNPYILLENSKLKSGYYVSLLESAYKQFSFVKKSNSISDSPNAFRDVKKADYETKLVWFKLLDNAVNKSKTDINELSNEYKHLLFREI